MKFPKVVLVLILVAVFISIASASAATNAGVKPGSFLYGFDTAFEKINLFFTFGPEKKARKLLEYAGERLAEAEAVAKEENTNAVKTAVAGYESNIVLVAEESKQIKDKGKAEGLLTSIADNTSKHQEILSDVLAKVPDEAKEAITKAIEASRKGQEEATKQVAELKSEVERLKKEVVELKSKEETNTKISEESNNQKSQNTSAFTKPQASPIIETTKTPKSPTSPPPQTQTKVSKPQSTPPASQSSNNANNTTPPQTIQPTPTETLKITSVNVVPDITSTKTEWQTNQPTESKLYLSGGGLSSKLYASEAGYTTQHFVFLTNLEPITDYSYQITAVGNSGFASYTGGFKTNIPPPTVHFSQNSQNAALGTHNFRISWQSGYVQSCSASGAWSGSKPTNGEELVSFNQVGAFTYNLLCIGLAGGTANATFTITVIDYRPKIIFYFNGSESTTNTYTTTVGNAVRLGWSAQYGHGCSASGDWSGEKSSGSSENLTLIQVGTFNYILTCVNVNGERGTNTATITITP